MRLGPLTQLMLLGCGSVGLQRDRVLDRRDEVVGAHQADVRGRDDVRARAACQARRGAERPGRGDARAARR